MSAHSASEQGASCAMHACGSGLCLGLHGVRCARSCVCVCAAARGCACMCTFCDRVWKGGDRAPMPVLSEAAFSSRRFVELFGWGETWLKTPAGVGPRKPASVHRPKATGMQPPARRSNSRTFALSPLFRPIAQQDLLALSAPVKNWECRPDVVKHGFGGFDQPRSKWPAHFFEFAIMSYFRTFVRLPGVVRVAITMHSCNCACGRFESAGSGRRLGV